MFLSFHILGKLSRLAVAVCTEVSRYGLTAHRCKMYGVCSEEALSPCTFYK